MKLLGSTLLLSLAALTAPATSNAACTGTALTQGELTTLLAGKTVCGRPGPSYPGNPSDRWQEEHRGSGQLWDYKMGPGHAVDPTKQVGDWAIGSAGNAGTITHRYPAGGATVFTWQVFGPSNATPGSVYAFCTVASTPAGHAVAFVQTGAAGCAGNFPAAGAVNAPANSVRSSRPIKDASVGAGTRTKDR